MKLIYTGSAHNPESFCLMTYLDEVTGERETIWNSCASVTPFVITSKAGNPAKHIDWTADQPQPLHVPAVGDRVFVLLTMGRAIERRRPFVEQYWDNAEYPMSASFPSKEEAAKRLAAGDLESCPVEVVEVDDELRAYFARRSADFKGLVAQRISMNARRTSRGHA